MIFGTDSGWGRYTNLSASNASFIGENLGDRAGASVSIGGDVNGDGIDDLAIGAPNNGDNGPRAGKVYLIFGKSSRMRTRHSLARARTMSRVLSSIAHVM